HHAGTDPHPRLPASPTRRSSDLPLLWAAYHSDVEMVKALLAAGADPDAANRFGMTPLMQASRYGDAEVIRALLDGGASLDVEHRSEEHTSELQSRENLVCRLLLE